MITAAAVKILLKKENKEVTIPCHRHGHAYQILRDLGFQPSDFKTIKQGFIDYEADPDDPFNGIETFLDREEALELALKSGRITESINDRELFSEDLW